MKFDFAYFVLLCFLQLGVFSLRDDFMIAHNFIVWAVVCGVAFATYPWLLAARGRSTEKVRFLSVVARAGVIFVFSTVVSFCILGTVASDHFAEWQLGLLLIVLPSAAASIFALLLSYAVLRFNRNG